MHTQVTPLHVYQRTLPPDTQHSLGLLASWIPAGARVLDLGCGAGGLGQLLRARGIELIDGLTYNPAEAEVARPWYRRVEVVDLDREVVEHIPIVARWRRPPTGRSMNP